MKWTFKSEHAYRMVLEHVTPAIARKCMFQMDNVFVDKWKSLCLMNDKFGGTIRDFNCRGVKMSGSNMRYLYQAQQILTSLRGRGVDMIEIGSGYGGLALFLHTMAPSFDVVIKSYTIFDLSCPARLTRRYLKQHGITVLIGDIENPKQQKGSFLISNYAYSELLVDWRTKYTDRVIKPFVSHGWMAWNAIPVYDFGPGLDGIRITPEIPKTGRMNWLVSW